jgi:signal peptidase I
MRTLRAWRALLASLVGLGLGYLYVGRPRLAIAVPVLVFGLGALFGWTRLILNPWALYAMVPALVLIAIVPVIHPMILARSYGQAPISRWTRVWVYIVWTAASFLFVHLIFEGRATIFGYEPRSNFSIAMSPTIQPGDHVMVDTWRYRSAVPRYGDLVVYDPRGRAGSRYLSRVVGVPGDEIELRDWKLYRNGYAVEEPYAKAGDGRWRSGANHGPVVLDDSSVFVLGDNRANAADSRMFGPIPLSLLRGRAVYRHFAYDEGIQWNRFPQLLVE